MPRSLVAASTKGETYFPKPVLQKGKRKKTSAVRYLMYGFHLAKGSSSLPEKINIKIILKLTSKFFLNIPNI
jgi:hypothetical protein